jgi:hypothetical protein
MAGHDPKHDHTPQEERRIRDAALDQTIEASFPASDPPSSMPNPDDHTAVARNRRRESEERARPGRLRPDDRG